MFTKSLFYGSTASACLALATPASAGTISVNFHVGDDQAGQAAHILGATDAAGVNGATGWNNIDVGNGATNTAAAQIFAPTVLADNMGNASAATIASTLTTGATATWFVGYAASAASAEVELSNGISDDGLFNSYLALNGPSGDGSPLDNFVLDITGLGVDFTGPGYSLIIYSDSDRRNTTSGNVRQSLFTVTPGGGSAIQVFTEDDDATVAVNTFDGTYIASDNVDDGADYSNYTVINGLTASTLTIEVTSDDGGRGAISGFQIVAVPEPGSLALLGLGGLMILRRRRG